MREFTVLALLDQILQTPTPKPRDLIKLDFYRQAMSLFQTEEAQMKEKGIPELELEAHQASHRELFRQLQEFSGPWEEFRIILERWQCQHEQELSSVARS